MQSDDQFIAAIQLECDRNNLSYKAITQENYYKRLEIAGLGESKPVHVLVYFGKKGLRPVIQGATNSALKTRVESISNKLLIAMGIKQNTESADSHPKTKKRLHTFNILQREKRDLIRYFIKGKFTPEEKTEQFCEYRFDLIMDDDRIVLKQYNSGKLVLSGPSNEAYKEIVRLIHNQLNDQKKTKSQQNQVDIDAPEESPRIAYPYIGTDESGKGDYFGPLVCAGVLVDHKLANRLKAIGVRDSKKSSDARNKALASEIKTLCDGKYSIVEIPPDKYNKLLAQMKSEGKSLNTLLAWGHARALENILETNPCKNAVADQFGNKKFIISKLQEKAKDLNLVQVHHAESNIGVAAASILARDRFLTKLQKLSNQYGITFPKGTSARTVEVARRYVQKFGASKLDQIAKLHFKTTNSVLET